MKKRPSCPDCKKSLFLDKSVPEDPIWYCKRCGEYFVMEYISALQDQTLELA